MKKHLLKLLLLCCIGILALSLFACVPSTEQYKLDFMVEGEVYHSRTTNGYSRITPPTDPEREGYVFAGWYFDEAFTVEYFSYSLEKNPITKDTKVYAKWIQDDSHTCTAGSWIVAKKATCKEEGLQCKYCTVDYCKKVMETEVIPLSTTHGKSFTVKKDEVPATCVTEGSYVNATYCSVCNQQLSASLQKNPIDKNAHDYTNSQLTKVGDKFNFTTQCSRSGCGTKVSLTNVTVTEVVDTPPTCTSVGWKHYEYASYGGAESESVSIPALGHTIVGVAIIDTVVYSEITNKEVIESIELFANNKSCGEEIMGLFVCDLCDANCTIRVEKPHVGTWRETEAPTCFSVGKETLDVCSACNAKNVKRNVAATGNHIDDNLALRKNGEKFDLVVPCVNAGKGCAHASVVLEDVPVSTQEIISGTCLVPDVIRYTFNGVDKTVSLDVVIRSGHFLNGVRASTIQDEEGWFDYRLVTPASVPGGIKLFDGRELSCDERHNGYFDCETCGDKVHVEIYRPHTGSWITKISSTCTSEGVSYFYCDFCTYGDDDTVTKPIPVEPHSYEWTLEVVENGTELSPFAMVGICSCGATDRVDNVLVTASISKQPTCSSEGEIIYTHNFNGTDYHTVEKIPKINHSIDGVVINAKDRFDYAEYVLTGKIKLAGAIACGSETPTPGYFLCSECSDITYVDVYRKHSGEVVEVLDVNTPCVKSGTRYLACVYSGCEGTEPVAFTETNHMLDVEIISSGSSHTIIATCTVSGCDYVERYENVSSVDAKVVVEASCSAVGIVEYTFISNSVSCKITSKVGKGDHHFHGVDYRTLLDADGYISKDLDGLRIISSEYAAFKCEVCQQLVQVAIKSDEE